MKVYRYFLDYCNLPNISGILDGTLVKITSPGGPTAELFRSGRKGIFCLNVQVICDEKLKFTNVVSRWFGSAHDSRIFNNSKIKSEFDNGEREGIILADSAYPLTPYMMIPYPHPPNSAIRGRFNKALCSARGTIERSIGVCKRRFPCLHFGLRTALDTSKVIIVACAVLHNLAIDLREDVPHDHDREIPIDTDNVELTPNDNNQDIDVYRPGRDFSFTGEEVRNVLAERFR